MKIHNIKKVYQFLQLVQTCYGGVWLKSKYGDIYNLKSKLSQFVSIAALLGYHGDELELWCDNKQDENILLDFLNSEGVISCE